MSALDALREACLARGVHGIFTISRAFRVIDEDGNRTLSREEFFVGLSEFGVQLNAAQEEELFSSIDTHDHGVVSFDEFLQALRPPMSQTRCEVIDQAFDKLDSSGTGVVSISDFRSLYDPTHDPRYKSQEMTADQILHEFISSFKQGSNSSDQLTRDEFQHYYSGASASIDSDEYFVTMMTNAWKL